MLSDFSCVQLSATPTVARQAPLSMEFSKQESWSGLLHPPPRVLPVPGIEPASVTSPALAAGSLSLAPSEWGFPGGSAVKNLPAN